MLVITNLTPSPEVIGVAVLLGVVYILMYLAKAGPPWQC